MGRFRKRNSDRPFYFKWKAANVPRSLMDLCDSRIYQFLDTHQNLEVPFASYKASPVNFSPFDIFPLETEKNEVLFILIFLVFKKLEVPTRCVISKITSLLILIDCCFLMGKITRPLTSLSIVVTLCKEISSKGTVHLFSCLS